MANNINNLTNNIGTNSDVAIRVANGGTTIDGSRVSRAQNSVGALRNQVPANPRSGGSSSSVDRVFSSRSYAGARSETSVNRSGSSGTSSTTPTNLASQQIISIIDDERIGPGYTLQNGDGSTTRTSINDFGQYQEVTTNADRTSTTAVFQDFPSDGDGLPTGYRVNYINKNASGRVTSTNTASLIISNVGNGRLAANFVDLTDPNSPQSLYTSTLTLSSAHDDDGKSFYNSQTSFADGSSASKSYQQLAFPTTFNPKMPSGYTQTTITTDANGNRSTYIEKVLTETNEQGNRVTTITNISDPQNPRVVSTKTVADPFIKSERKSGSEINQYLDYINQSGFLDITGDGRTDPMADLMLINRYSRGLRNDALFANINLSGATKTTAEMQSKLSEGFSRGIYDIDGSGTANPNSKSSLIDINLIARYMFGARGTALTDPREANDDSISIAANGSNLLALADNNPLLNDFRQIFNIEGKSLTVANQSVKAYFINLEQTGAGEIDSSSGRIIRGGNNASLDRLGRDGTAPLAYNVINANTIKDRHTGTPLGDLVTGDEAFNDFVDEVRLN